ncbi:hypothetical protein DITRI_Ditri17bG0030200 [Diplodiscus trichospermus]
MAALLRLLRHRIAFASTIATNTSPTPLFTFRCESFQCLSPLSDFFQFSLQVEGLGSQHWENRLKNDSIVTQIECFDALNVAKWIKATGKDKVFLLIQALNIQVTVTPVSTLSLFSMDGDFAPMVELVKLRKKHNFLLVFDDGLMFLAGLYKLLQG